MFELFSGNPWLQHVMLIFACAQKVCTRMPNEEDQSMLLGLAKAVDVTLLNNLDLG